MREVTKDQFFAAIGPENVHPRSDRDVTIWEMVHTRQIVGRSEPGYIPHATPKRWWLTEEFAVKKLGSAA